MKIAIFHELDLGGARRAVNEISKEIKKNHLVDLYIVDEKDMKEEKNFFNDVFFYNFIPKKWSGGNWKIRLYKDTIELYRLHKLHKSIAKKINAKKYDVIFVHPSKYTQAPFILRFLQGKKIYYCQEPLRIAYDPTIASIDTIPLLKRPYEYINRIIRKYIDLLNIERADLVLSNSKYSQEAIKKAYGIKSTICYLGVDDKVFRPIHTKKRYDLLFIGERNERSGYPLLMEALSFFGKEPKVRLIIRSSEKISDEELSRVYNSTKVVVVLSKNEPFGLIPLEAMACGTPVVAVDEGGYKETVINGKTGYLVKRNAKLLAETIEGLLGNPQKASELGENGRKAVLRYWTWEKNAAAFVKIFNKYGIF